jgi:uncharacterized lipoprotein YajG
MNQRLRSVLAVLAVGVLAQGCNVEPHNIRLEPSVPMRQSDVGRGKVVGLEVVDTRADKKLGVVGDPEGKFIYLSLTNDPAQAVYKQVSRGLEKLGFSVQPASDPAERSLKVDLSDLTYESIKKKATFDTLAKVSVGATVRNGPDSYDRTYNVKQEKAAGAPPSASDDAKVVNGIVSMALEDMLSDKQLVALLAK